MVYQWYSYSDLTNIHNVYNEAKGIAKKQDIKRVKVFIE